MGTVGVKVEDCVPTHSSYVIGNPLGFWVGTGRWGQWRGGWGLGGLGSGIVFPHILLMLLAGGRGGWGQWGGGDNGKGLGLEELGGLGSRIHIHMGCLYTWVGLGSLYTWTATLLTVIEKKCFPRVIY